MDNRFFNSYPYTDFHELNLSWVVSELRSFATTLEQFVSINALKYADPIQWNITTQYEKNTIVIDPASGTAYISVDAVPSGVDITNTDYWTVVFNLGPLLEVLSDNLTEHDAGIGATSEIAVDKDDWLLWKNGLYVALSDILAGDQLVMNSNISKITVEDYVPTYYPNEERLVVGGKVGNDGPVISGDYHIYDAAGQAIRILKV